MSEVQGNPRRQDFLVINDEEQTPTVLNPMSGQVFITNSVGRQVLELADGGRNVDSIVDAIVKSFIGASRDVIRQEVGEFLKESQEKGLVTWTGGGHA